MAIKQAPQNKSVLSTAATPPSEPTVGRLAVSHGVVACSCGRRILHCGHMGHALVIETVERGCAVCQGG